MSVEMANLNKDFSHTNEGFEEDSTNSVITVQSRDDTIQDRKSTETILGSTDSRNQSSSESSQERAVVYDIPRDHIYGDSPYTEKEKQFIPLPSKDTGSHLQSYDKQDDEYNPEHASHLYVWLLSFFAAIGGFLFGYDTGVVSGAMLLLKDEFSLSSFWQELVVSVTIGGAFVAALLGGYLNDRYGRKAITIVASVIFTAGSIVLGAAENVEMLVGGRLIVGFGIGFASMTVPVYIAECAPVHLRGRLVTVNNMFITGGQFIASVMDGGFSYVEPDGWRYMLGVAAVPACIQFVGFFFLPESPRWLMKKGQEQKAREVLTKLRGTKAVERELGEMRRDFEMEEANKNKDGITIIRILKTPPVRRALIVGCGLQLFQQLSGINTVMYYSATIIKMAGIGDQHMAIWLAALTASMNFIFTFVGVWLVERIGRKKLIMSSMFGTMLSVALLAVAFQLAALNSPDITQFDNSTSSACSLYTTCEACIEDTSCGFCFTGEVGSINGSCLPFNSEESTHSTEGQCANSTLPDGVMWASNYCPTSYSWMAILGLVLYLVFFAPGMGPMPWTINSEIHPLWARSTGNSLSAATNWISNLLVSMTFLTLTEEITKYGTYWLFVGITILGMLFFALFLPETKGKKLEEVEELFAKPWCGWCSSSNNTVEPKQSYIKRKDID